MKKILAIAICDDDIFVCSTIENLLHDFEDKQNKKMFKIDVFYSSENLYKELKNSAVFDLIFLEIRMDNIDGIQIGEFIRENLLNDILKIVYMSSFTEYALQLFKVHPIDFLIKPINKNMITRVMNTVLRILKYEDDIFQYKIGRDWNSVYINNIIYFQGCNREIKMVTTDNIITFYGSLENTYSMLKKHRFIYTHKSYIVNYNQIKEFYYHKLIMTNGAEITIAQNRRKEFRKIQKNWVVSEI